MPVIIKLKFIAGRYHATPWGRHVNEGVVEWPPSPWRLLRALVAVWRRTCPDLPEARVKRILSALAQPPRFSLPPKTVAHTRHYMPLGKNSPKEISGGGTTLVFDTFASIGRDDPLYVGWPDAELGDDDMDGLSTLLRNLSSLGRAESWVHGEIHVDPVELPIMPAVEHDPDPIPVFCPDPDLMFGDAHYPTLDPKKLATGRANPLDFLFDCPRWHLCLDTETIQKERWPTVPGAKWVNYSLTDAPVIAHAHRDVAPRPTHTVARFMIDSDVLPLITDTLAVAEAFRRALMGRFGKWCKEHPEQSQSFLRSDEKSYASPVLAGKDASGNALHGHGHAHFLPSGEGDDPRRITHVTVYAPNGFGAAEQAALFGLKRLDRFDEDPLRIQLVGLGKPRNFTAPLLRLSRIWESITPFVPHRHLKRRGTRRDTPHLMGPDPVTAFVELTLRESLSQAGRGEPSITTSAPGPGLPRPRDYHRARSRKDDDGIHRPFGWFRLVFPEPVLGPLCLGYGCHFGLGLFKAINGDK